jgi:sugar/nucleoside kinase (ribokinase family)
LGCLEHYEASDMQTVRNQDNNAQYHIHIACYYNIPGFWNGALKSTMQKIRNECKNNIIVSLVPQCDATERWDGELINLLEEIDILILNEVEANCITKCRSDEDVANFFYDMSPFTHVIVTKGEKGAISLYQGQVINDQCACQSIEVVDSTDAGDAFATGFIHGLHESNSVHSNNDKNNAFNNIQSEGTAAIPRKPIDYDAIKNGLR